MKSLFIRLNFIFWYGVLPTNHGYWHFCLYAVPGGPGCLSLQKQWSCFWNLFRFFKILRNVIWKNLCINTLLVFGTKLLTFANGINLLLIVCYSTVKCIIAKNFPSFANSELDSFYRAEFRSWISVPKEALWPQLSEWRWILERIPRPQHRREEV